MWREAHLAVIVRSDRLRAPDDAVRSPGTGTTVAREVRGGVTTFLTMAYILFANPSILAAAGVPFEAAAAATAAAAASARC